MSRTHERAPDVDRDPDHPTDRIVAITTETGVIIYDERNPNAWISSTAARAVAETR